MYMYVCVCLYAVPIMQVYMVICCEVCLLLLHRLRELSKLYINQWRLLKRELTLNFEWYKVSLCFYLHLRVCVYMYALFTIVSQCLEIESVFKS